MRVFFGKEAREKLMSGIAISVNAIKTTLGGAGKTSIAYKGGIVEISKDGVTLARNIILDDPIENCGAVIIRNVTEKTLSDAGDNTTSTAVLTQKILELGFAEIDAGVRQIDLQRGIQKAVDIVSEELKKMSKPVGDDNEKIKNIATISANGDQELGSLIASAFKEVGNEGDVFIEESRTFKTHMRTETGFRIDRGYMSPLFANQATFISELTHPLILLYDGKIDKWKQIEKVMNAAYEKKIRDILIICENVEGEALKMLLVNHINNPSGKGGFNICCVNAPSFGERRRNALEDIAALTNATYISNEKGITDITIDMCGTCERVIVRNNDTTIIGTNASQEAINKIFSQIDNLIEQAETDMEVLFLKQRKSRVRGKLSVISCGAPSDIEMKEKKDRVEDAILSVKAAIEMGIVPGGGIALLRCAEKLNESITDNKHQQKGIKIIKECLEAPLRQILHNAGIMDVREGEYDGMTKDELVNQLKSASKPEMGYNVQTDKIEDLYESGIIDAAKVVMVSLVNAASVAGTILTAETLII